MKSIVDDAVQQFKVSTTLTFSLSHKNKKVNLSVPFRLLSIPNNAVLELVCEDKKVASGAITETRLAISCDSGFGNLAGKFRSDMTLLEVLASFVEQGALPAPLLDPQLHFTPPVEVIYLRQRFQGLDALQSCSLTSLGLSGSSARLQLRVPTAVHNPPPISSPSVETSPSIAVTVNPTDTIVTFAGQQQQVLEEDKVVSIGSSSIEGVPLNVSIPPPPRKELSQCSVMGNADELMDVCPPDVSAEVEHFPIATPTSAPPISPAAVHVAVSSVMNANFDATSKKAITTVLKFLDNLIKYPDRDGDADETAGLAKYRGVNLGNQIVRDQILSCNNGLELLRSIGFVIQKSSEKLTFGYLRIRQDWVLSPQTLAGYTLQSACSDQSDGGEVFVSALLAVRKVLVSALSELEGPSSPSSSSGKTAPISTLALLQSIARKQAPSGQSGGASPTVTEFDPFKPLIMRASADKVEVKAASSGKSHTQAKLDQFNKRRRELEGERSSVERMTQVSIKGVNLSGVAPKKETMMEDVYEETDGQIQARALKQVMMKLGAQEDEGPAMTTKAIKELEKAQKSLVYCQTLIKIVLPDKVCLQAYFHPRDTLKDIVHWLNFECFRIGELASLKEADDNDAVVVSCTPHHDFDLYTSPPRRSLFSPDIKPTVRGSHRTDNVAAGQQVATLYDLSLVPSALIHLAWQGSSVQEHALDDGTGATYLSPSLVAKLRGDTFHDANAPSIPSGKRLVPDNFKEPDLADQKQVSTCGRRQDASASGKESSAKPKWFKL